MAFPSPKGILRGLAFASLATVAAPAAADEPSTRSPSATGPSATTPSALGAQPTFSAAQIQEAEERWREGRALYEAGRIDEARLKYAQAFAVLQRTNILWNLAVSEFHSNRPLDALRHFEAFTRRSDADATDVKRAREKYIPEAWKLTGHVLVEAPSGTEVSVDGEVQPGAAPFADPVAVSPGSHRLEARLDDLTRDQSVDAPAGATVTARFDFPARTVAALPPSGAVVREPPATARIVTTAALGVAALTGLGLGIGFGVDSQNKNNENAQFVAAHPDACADRSNALCTQWQSDLSAQRTSATVSTVGYIAAGVLGAAAVGTWFLWPKSSAEAPSARSGAQSVGAARTRPWAVPVIGSGGFTIQAGGSF